MGRVGKGSKRITQGRIALSTIVAHCEEMLSQYTAPAVFPEALLEPFRAVLFPATTSIAAIYILAFSLSLRKVGRCASEALISLDYSVSVF